MWGRVTYISELIHKKPNDFKIDKVRIDKKKKEKVFPKTKVRMRQIKQKTSSLENFKPKSNQTNKSSQLAVRRGKWIVVVVVVFRKKTRDRWPCGIAEQQVGEQAAVEPIPTRQQVGLLQLLWMPRRQPADDGWG